MLAPVEAVVARMARMARKACLTRTWEQVGVWVGARAVAVQQSSIESSCATRIAGWNAAIQVPACACPPARLPACCCLM
jgi:hypothetical protein